MEESQPEQQSRLEPEETEESKPEPKSVPNPKKARSEGNRIAMAIKATKAEFYVSDADLDDHFTDVILAQDMCRKTLGKLDSAFMIISAGSTTLSIVISVPKEKIFKLNAKNWLIGSLKGINGQVSEDTTDFLAKACIEIDNAFKLKDLVRSNAFAVLRENKLLEEEEEEEGEEGGGEMFDF